MLAASVPAQGMCLFQHGLRKNAVASCRSLTSTWVTAPTSRPFCRMGTAAHPLHDAAGLCQQCRVGDAQHHIAARVGIVHLFNIDAVAAGRFAVGSGQYLCRAGQHLLRKGKLRLLPGNGGAYRAVDAVFAVDADPAKGVVADKFTLQLPGAARRCRRCSPRSGRPRSRRCAGRPARRCHCR